MMWFIFLHVAMAAGIPQQGVIDLGELSVKGEVRRPAVQFYQLKTLHPHQLQELSELGFDQLEQDLLKPVETVNENN